MNIDLACYSDTMLIDALLDAVAHSDATRISVLINEVRDRGLEEEASTRAKAWTVSPRSPLGRGRATTTGSQSRPR